MNPTLSLIIFLAVAAFYVFARYRDISTSVKTSWYYGLDESNPLWRDKDGEFSSTKNIIASAAVLAGSAIVGGFLSDWWQGTPLMIIWGVASMIVASGNDHKAKVNRQKQIDFLNYIKDGGDKNWPNPIIRNGKFFFPLFHWLWVPSTGDIAADISAASTRVFALSQKPQSEWFPG